MSSQRYERVRPCPADADSCHPRPPMTCQLGHLANIDEQVSAIDGDSPTSPDAQIPHSPPPSFQSRTNSPSSRLLAPTPVDQNLSDTFDADGSDSEDENDGDDRQRLMRGTPSMSSTEQITTATADAEAPRPVIERRVTQLPAFPPATRPGGRVYGGGSGTDGVFANLSAKPEIGEKLEEHPPVSFVGTT